ncbi:MAG: RNA polymerase sigma factor SigJ [Actinomycetales bacterium]|nr:RNA polymerase sigma factor SigJ [Actinomycetales bacterium]
MSSASALDVGAVAERERPRLVALAYRLLGTLADAEDVVQETLLRWARLDDDERARIENPQAWLTRVAGRVGLDHLTSARARRELYVGPWLPEPLPAGAPGAGASSGVGGAHHAPGLAPTPAPDPLDAAATAEQVSTALLVVLETTTPAERVAFVLHDVFAVPFDEIAELLGRSPAATRQLATSARRRVDSARTVAVPRAEHDAVVAAFAAAAQSGDLAALVRVLDPSVTARSDGGGVVSAARKPVAGAERVARFVLGILEKQPDARVEPVATADGLAFSLHLGGTVTGVLNVGVAEGRVAELWIAMNPAKLGAWA